MASSFLKICLSSSMLLLLIFISPSFSSPTTRNNHLPFSSTASKLIRRLNVSPKNSINITENNPSFVPGSIVEKKFKFPGLADSAISVPELGHHAGYYSLPRSKAARMFYFFFESRNSKDDPVVIWLTGGPGCSSELALFYENGPFHLTNNFSVVWNEYGWDKVSNILFIDQPTGTGFSYTSDDSDIRHDTNTVSYDLYDFLQAFFKEHSQFAKNDFYITGESMAGHYIPALASRIQKGNKAKEGIHINLKGLAIGNGLTSPEIQYPALTDFALNLGIIKKNDYDRINKMIPQCKQAIKSCGTKGGDACIAAYGYCSRIFNEVIAISGNINYFDIRKICKGPCYEFSQLENFLNQKNVREALGVGNLDFITCSATVYDAMMQDWMQNLEGGIPSLLEDGIKLLIYAGEEDLICNWLGQSRWVHAMEWSGQKQFGGSSEVPFLVDGKNSGTLKNHGPLAFLKVKEGGHMLPLDQPKASLQMLKEWLEGKW